MMTFGKQPINPVFFAYSVFHLFLLQQMPNLFVVDFDNSWVLTNFIQAFCPVVVIDAVSKL